MSMRLFTIFLSMMAQFCFSQNDQQVTTVLFSSVATPHSINQLVKELPDRGIELNIDFINWNDDQSRIEEVELSIRFRMEDGALTAPNHHTFKYNILNEGTILFLHNGGKYPIQILAHNQNLLVNQGAYSDLPDMIFAKKSNQNRIYSSFYQPFSADDDKKKNIALEVLSRALQANNKLMAAIVNERDPGHETYTYRYYYNGTRLYGTLGINPMDMTGEAIIKEDSDRILSLFVNSQDELSLHAATYDW